MDERLLHYIWKYQRFPAGDLFTTTGDKITIFSTGIHNENAGPDFQEARIKIRDITWVGCVEIHINASDWFRHDHQRDPKYDNTILHVVWKHDKDVPDNKGKFIPTLELKKLIDPQLLLSYNSMMDQKTDLACQAQIRSVNTIYKADMLSKTLVERMQSKANEVLHRLKSNNGDWDNTAFQYLAKSFGGNLNQDLFLQLAASISLNTVQKHSANALQIESLVFGLAGFLKDPIDEYSSKLKFEFEHLERKLKMEPRLQRSAWNFHRLRPSSFPSVRLAQLSSFIHEFPRPYSAIIDCEDWKKILNISTLRLTGYWKEHFDFGKKWTGKSMGAGPQFFQTILINGLVPVLMASSKFFNSQEHMDKAISWVEGLEAEDNKYTRLMTSMSFQIENAADSQGVLQLYKDYCQRKRCANCNIGVQILQNTNCSTA